eukprot:6207930-Pleurochrysis_carterae.AAC.1
MTLLLVSSGSSVAPVPATERFLSLLIALSFYTPIYSCRTRPRAHEAHEARARARTCACMHARDHECKRGRTHMKTHAYMHALRMYTRAVLSANA